MMEEGVYGGGKAGAPFDPLTFIQRPQVILRAVTWLFSVIIFGCISAEGWSKDAKGVEHCHYNNDSNACNYGVGISVIAFLASIGFIVGEYFFEQMSSVKTRKRYVMADMGFSALWSFLYFIGFCYLTNQWTKAEAPEYVVNNMQAAIVFNFFAIFPWAGAAYLAFLRYRQGSAQAFAPSYEADPTNMGGYNSYPDATDPDGGYSQPPFAGQPAQPQSGMQQAPPY
ncbi:synaptogyrin-like [Homarus americanus]|uniref:synaptogyrin-like n=1 Tax=Homarus americanus TaxID=6706 RepID=UPI001C473937|nr:synaptogyrin-like [Homarus americanus]